MVKIAFNVFAYLSLLGQVGILIVLSLYFIKSFSKNKIYKKIKIFISKNAYYLAFFLSLIATLSSLFISEIAKFPPCVLCWYQRIAMYPQPVLLFIAILKKEYVLKPYLITINIIGGTIALYHYLLQILPKSQFITCNKSLTGIAVSCTEKYNFYFGYMSFPLMALTVFILLIIIILFSNNAKNTNRSK
jgi:disulfide bond formation protein DsbB